MDLGLIRGGAIIEAEEASFIFGVGQKKSAFSSFRKRSAILACGKRFCQGFVPRLEEYAEV